MIKPLIFLSSLFLFSSLAADSELAIPPLAPVQEPDLFFDELAHMAMTLGMILVLIFFISWLLKRLLNTRMEQANATSTIKILDKRSISPKSAIYLIQVEEKKIILAESQNGIFHLGSEKETGVEQ